MTAEQIEIMAPALATGIAVALVHAPLGIEVLKRGIVFIDLAIAQIVGLVIVLMRLFCEEPSWLALQAGTAAAAVFSALVFRWVEKAMPREQEAVIGCAFILAASLTLLALANHPHGGEEIQHILSGQILFVSWTDLGRALPILSGVLACWLLWPRARRGLGFFLLFALAITASVKLVGVYVVFASLILPALAVRAGMTPRARLGPAWASALLAVSGGIVLSSVLDLPAGPMMVLFFAASAAAFRLALGPPPHGASGRD